MRERLGSLLSPLRIALVYLVLGTLALVFSDVVLVRLVEDPARLRDLQAIKGQVEVVLTALVIYALVATYHRASEETTREVEHARDRLAFLNNLLRHHVLNRMNIVQGHVDRLVEEDAADPERLATIRRQSAAVVGLVENVRALSGPMARGRDRTPVDLSGAVREEVERARGRHPVATIDAAVPDDVTVEADDSLPLVFEELLDNAVEHSGAAESTVSVTVDVEGDRVTVGVGDDGPGVPEAARSGPPEGERRGHEGMGLFLVRTLVERYGGEVRFGTPADGGGLVEVELSRAVG